MKDINKNIEEILIRNNDWNADDEEVEISGVEFSRETMNDVINDLTDYITENYQPKTTSTDIEELRREYFIAVGQGKVKDIETAWTWFAPHISNNVRGSVIRHQSLKDNSPTMYRPKWEDIKINGYIQCTCGQILQTQEAVREHWQEGHFDTPHLSNKSELKSAEHIKREAVEEFVYHYWCYNPTTGTTVYPDSVELDVIAGSETEALKIAKKMVKDRGFYKLQTVSNLSQLNKEEE